jgi:tRNA nucleotidyltransferase/poly(A) polymerase
MTEILFNKYIQYVLKTLIHILKPDEAVYLVGGVVRDLFLIRDIYDIDFAVKGNVRKIARLFADNINAPFFMLNESFDTARVVWTIDENTKIFIDLVGLRGSSIEADLKARDFTINALAIDIKNPNQIIDPNGGLQDIQSKLIRSCSDITFKDDPLRILRAVRQSVIFGYRIENQTLTQLKNSVGAIRSVSDERLRDELFKLFEMENPVVALVLLKQLGIVPQIFHEIKDLLFYQSPTMPPESVWEHTISAIKNMSLLFNVLVGEYTADGARELQSGKAVLKLGRFRESLENYFQESISGERSVRSLLFFCAFFHDVGKRQSERKREDGSISFRGHNSFSLDLFEKTAIRLALSNLEIKWAGLVINNHMEIHQAAKDPGDVDSRWLYRFIKSNQDSGIGLVFFSLADCLAHQYELGFEDRYEKELNISRKIYDAYFGEDDRLRNPPKYLDGKEIMSLTQLDAGPKLGQLIRQLEEETAIGKLNSIQEAIAYVKDSANLPQS